MEYLFALCNRSAAAFVTKDTAIQQPTTNNNVDMAKGQSASDTTIQGTTAVKKETKPEIDVSERIAAELPHGD